MNRNPPNKPATSRQSLRWSFRACLLLVAALTAIGPAGAQDDGEDYERWRSYDARTRDRVFRDSVKPNWFGKGQDRFWYRVSTGEDRHEFVLVDARKGQRRAAFDHRQLATAIGRQTQKSVRHDRLELKGLAFADDAKSCQFTLADRNWRFHLPAGPLEPTDAERTDSEASVSRATASGQGNRDPLPPLARVRRSVAESSKRTPIRFDNRLSTPLECLWVTADGEMRWYGAIAAKSSRQLSTFAGHAWVLRSGSGKSGEGHTLAAFVADPQRELAIIDVTTPRPEPLGQRRDRHRAERSSTSPDGKWRVTFDQGNVVVVDSESGIHRQVTEDATDSDLYRGPVWWSPDSAAMVVMKTQLGAQRTINLIDSAPDDSIHARLIEIPYAKPGDAIDHPRPVLFRVDQFRPQVIEDSLFCNPFGITDLRWRDDSSAFSFLYNQRGHQSLRLISVDAATGSPRTVIDETSKTFVCYSGKKYLRRLDASGEVIWMSERDRAGIICT